MLTVGKSLKHYTKQILLTLTTDYNPRVIPEIDSNRMEEKR